MEMWPRMALLLKDKRAMIMPDGFPPFMMAETVIGNTSYIVSSFHKNDAKSNAVDKIRRMIERDIENIAVEDR
jgi:hypothetical protein